MERHVTTMSVPHRSPKGKQVAQQLQPGLESPHLGGAQLLLTTSCVAREE